MQINKLFTPFNYSNGELSRVKYIVINYVGALGGAEANCKYYASQYVGASAHYYVGFSGEIWQSVEDKNIAWHCGAKSYIHPECRNNNSIGVELCVRNAWHEDKEKNLWYWFDGAGMMVTNTWYKYNGDWYYLGPDGAMCKSQLIENSENIYAVGADGKMITAPVKLSPDQDGALQYQGLA